MFLKGYRYNYSQTCSIYFGFTLALFLKKRGMREGPVSYTHLDVYKRQHRGYPGEVAELKIDCDCRKPKPGLLLRAAEDYNIDLTKSWMIGDSENDVQAGRAAECKTMRIGENGSASLLDAVERIMEAEE